MLWLQHALAVPQSALISFSLRMNRCSKVVACQAINGMSPRKPGSNLRQCRVVLFSHHPSDIEPQHISLPCRSSTNILLRLARLGYFDRLPHHLVLVFYYRSITIIRITSSRCTEPRASFFERISKGNIDALGLASNTANIEDIKQTYPFNVELPL